MADRDETATDQAATDRAAAFLAAHPAAGAAGITVLAAAAGRASVALTVGPDHVNGHQVCHGGVIFTLADTAWILAAHTGGGTATSTGATIELLSPAPLGAELTATCAEVHTRGRTAVYDAVVTTPDGTIVALARGRLRVVDG